MQFIKLNINAYQHLIHKYIKRKKKLKKPEENYMIKYLYSKSFFDEKLS